MGDLKVAPLILPSVPRRVPGHRNTRLSVELLRELEVGCELVIGGTRKVKSVTTIDSMHQLKADPTSAEFDGRPPRFRGATVVRDEPAVRVAVRVVAVRRESRHDDRKHERERGEKIASQAKDS